MIFVCAIKYCSYLYSVIKNKLILTIMTTVTTTKNAYNAKESLKSSGFTFDSTNKQWTKKFDSEEEFESWKSEKFLSATYSGRKQSKYNEAVEFDVVTEVEEAKEIELSSEELIENGKIENFEFDCFGRAAILDGFFIIEVATGKITDFRLAPKDQWIGLKQIILKQYERCNGNKEE